MKVNDMSIDAFKVGLEEFANIYAERGYIVENKNQDFENTLTISDGKNSKVKITSTISETKIKDVIYSEEEKMNQYMVDLGLSVTISIMSDDESGLTPDIIEEFSHYTGFEFSKTDGIYGNQ